MMEIQALRPKDERVIRLIVEMYLKEGTPISSSKIARKTDFPVSPATVRNIMSKLEEAGFLLQPHASSGRIPTDRGLRYYVNSIFEEMVYPEDEWNLEADDFGINKGDLNSMLNQVSSTLSEYSDNLGFVLSPRISQLNFKHIRLIKVSEEKVMIILITNINLVLTEIAETMNYFTQLELDRASQYINENFRGRNMVFVRDYLIKKLPEYRIRYEKSIQKLSGLLKDYITQEEDRSQVFMQGTSKLLDKPELLDMDQLKSLFKNFEEKAKMAKLLSDFISLDRVKVIIGSELDIPDISECALVLAHYGYDRQILGSLGILGPKRISYKKIIPLVDRVAQRLSDTIRSF